MRKKLSTGVVFFTLLCILPLRACPPGDSLAAVNDTTAILSLPEECFCKWLAQSRAGAAALIPMVNRYCDARRISDTLLLCAYGNDAIRGNASVFTAILHRWKGNNPAPLVTLQHYRQTGDPRRVDTLCAILDYSGNAEMSVLMRWIDAKKVLDDLEPVPELFCRIIDEKPGLLSMALNQFTRLLDEVEDQRTNALLKTFSRCAKCEDMGRRSELLSWLVEQFGRRQQFKDLIAAVGRFENDPALQSTILLNIARMYAGRKSVDAALVMAKSAFKAAKERKARQECAGVIFELYSNEGEDDSARIWMDRAGPEIASAVAAFGAITVFQSTGTLDSAAVRLAALPSSAAKDTLMLRQLLFCDSAAAACRFAFSDTFGLRPESVVNLWRIRTAIFSGEYSRARGVIDSLTVRALAASSELTEYRYWLLRLSGASEELAKFSTIQYTMFVGNRRKAAEIVCGEMNAEPDRWRIAVQVAKMQLDRHEADAAVVTLECAPAENEPQYLYLLAEALYRCGRNAEAVTRVKRLLSEFSASMYASRGRLLVARAEKKENVGGSEK